MIWTYTYPCKDFIHRFCVFIMQFPTNDNAAYKHNTLHTLHTRYRVSAGYIISDVIVYDREGFPATDGSAPGSHIRFGHKLNGMQHGVMFLPFCIFRIPMLLNRIPRINVSCSRFLGIYKVWREPHVMIVYTLNIRRTSLSLIKWHLSSPGLATWQEID